MIMLALGKCSSYFRLLFNDTVSISVTRFNVSAEAKMEYLLDIFCSLHGIHKKRQMMETPFNRLLYIVYLTTLIVTQITG
jgi:hypothetical protein